MLPSAVRFQTILVVDNDPDICKLLNLVLKEAGFRVLMAQNGAAALLLAMSVTVAIDLLISAVEMRSMSGTELGLQFQFDRPETGILLMYAESTDLHILPDGWGYIEKPFTMSAFVDLTHAMLVKKKSATSNGVRTLEAGGGWTVF